MKPLEIQTKNFPLIPQVERPTEIRKELPRRKNAVPPYETKRKIISNCQAFERSRSESLGNYINVYA